MIFDNRPIDNIYEENADSLYGYYCDTAPLLLTKNVRSQRRINNGTLALAHDALGPDGRTLPALAMARQHGGYQEIFLDEPPAALIVRVGSPRRRRENVQHPPY